MDVYIIINHGLFEMISVIFFSNHTRQFFCCWFCLHPVIRNRFIKVSLIVYYFIRPLPVNCCLIWLLQVLYECCVLSLKEARTGSLWLCCQCKHTGAWFIIAGPPHGLCHNVYVLWKSDELKRGFYHQRCYQHKCCWRMKLLAKFMTCKNLNPLSLISQW